MKMTVDLQIQASDMRILPHLFTHYLLNYEKNSYEFDFTTIQYLHDYVMTLSYMLLFIKNIK